MIETDPNNSLLLGNYARFLKEVTVWIIIIRLTILVYFVAKLKWLKLLFFLFEKG